MDSATTRLLQDARGGSPEALDTLCAQMAPRLLAFIRLRLGSRLRARVESRDILQACLLKAVTRLDQFAGPDSPSLMAWLTRTAEREILDQADFHGRQRRAPERECPLDLSPDVTARLHSQLSRLILDDRRRHLESALEALPQDYREVILLRFFHEMSLAGIGERMGRSPDACRMLLARALSALTLHMREEAP